MTTTEHYLRILMSFPTTPDKGQVVSMSIECLSEILYCTPRNVRIILRKLVDEGFVSWQAGKGRGNVSQMALLRNLEEVSHEYFHSLMLRDKMKEAMDFLYHKTLSGHVRNKLRALLDERFGFQVERSNSVTVDLLRLTLRRTQVSLDPGFESTAVSAFLLKQFCNTLITYDPASKTYLPSLAHAWEHNEDGTRWTFYLRKGVRFHHGRHFTSSDVLYTFERLKEINSPSRWLYEEIVCIDVESDYQISFELRHSNYLFLHFFGSFYTSILPHDVGYSERCMIGTGPFRMREFTNQLLVLEAFEDYFKERPILDRVELWLVPEDVQNVLYQLPCLDESRQLGKSPWCEIEYQIDGSQCLIFNYTKPGVCHDRHFRKAMRIVFNRMAIIRELKENRNLPAYSFLPDKSKQVCDTQVEALEEAMIYLQRSGYSGEVLKLYYVEKNELFEDAKWLRRRCESIGLHISLHPIQFSDYNLTDAKQRADLLITCESLEDDTEWGYLRLFQDEVSFLHQFFNEDQHEWLNIRLESFVRTPSYEDRFQIIDQIEQRMLEEDWILFGYHENKVSQHHPALNGLLRDSYGWVDLSKLWIKTTYNSTPQNAP